SSADDGRVGPLEVFSGRPKEAGVTVHGAAERRAREHDCLVGRADELDSLEQGLDELSRGQPAAIELVGEPGIGKTRLLDELAARAELRGHLVLTGSASELERDLPFSVF